MSEGTRIPLAERQLIVDALDGSAALLETIHGANDGNDDPWIVDLYATVRRALAAVRELEATP